MSKKKINKPKSASKKNKNDTAPTIDEINELRELVGFPPLNSDQIKDIT